VIAVYNVDENLTPVLLSAMFCLICWSWYWSCYSWSWLLHWPYLSVLCLAF